MTAAPIEVARHARAEPGSPQTRRRHFPPAPAGAINREPKAGSDAEAAFLALGDGAALWLKEAAAQGTLTDPGEDGARRVDREADQPGPGRLGARARRRAPTLR